MGTARPWAAATKAASACSPTSIRPWRRRGKPSNGSRVARIEDRNRIIAHIRRIAIDQCVELGTMEMEETKIGRLPHKIEKLKTLGQRRTGVEFLHSEVFSGDHGLAVIEHAPFGVIAAVTPVTHSLAHDHRQRGQHDRRRQHGGVQPASQRAAHRRRGRATLQRGDLPRLGARQPAVSDHRADPGDRPTPCSSIATSI